MALAAVLTCVIASPAAADFPRKAPRASLIQVLRSGKQALVLDRATGEYQVVKVGDVVQGFRVSEIEEDQIILASPVQPERYFVLPLVEAVPAAGAKPGPAGPGAGVAGGSGAGVGTASPVPGAPPAGQASPAAPGDAATGPAGAADASVMDPYGDGAEAAEPNTPSALDPYGAPSIGGGGAGGGTGAGAGGGAGGIPSVIAPPASRAGGRLGTGDAARPGTADGLGADSGTGAGAATPGSATGAGAAAAGSAAPPTGSGAVSAGAAAAGSAAPPTGSGAVSAGAAAAGSAAPPTTGSGAASAGSAAAGSAAPPTTAPRTTGSGADRTGAAPAGAAPSPDSNVTTVEPTEVRPGASSRAPANPPREQQRKLSRRQLDAALADFSALGKQIRIERAAGGGVRIADIERGSFFAGLGFEPGDLVRRVDGHPIGTVDEAAAAYASLASARDVLVEIERRGAPLRIRFQLTK